MTCRGCGHIYPIQNGIPNMVSVGRASASERGKRRCGREQREGRGGKVETTIVARLVRTRVCS